MIIMADNKPGLWENIRKKRARGEPPAKPGEEGYPDKDAWKKLTAKQIAEKEQKRKKKNG